MNIWNDVITRKIVDRILENNFSPCIQTQLKPFRSSMHDAPLEQGRDKHSSMSSSQNCPLK
jgi:hypothetical protein